MAETLTVPTPDTPPKAQTCPRCGYCPACGRVGLGVASPMAPGILPQHQSQYSPQPLQYTFTLPRVVTNG